MPQIMLKRKKWKKGDRIQKNSILKSLFVNVKVMKNGGSFAAEL